MESNTNQGNEAYINSLYLKRYPKKRDIMTTIKYELNKIIREESLSKESKSSIEDLKKLNSELFILRCNEEEDTSDYPHNFKELSLCSYLIDNLNFFKFTEMTPIQSLSIPNILEGSDVVGCAQTGSGKTIAYLVPIIQHLLTNEPTYPSCDYSYSFPLVLIILPTRELAIQTYRESLKMLQNTNIVPVVIHGGEGNKGQQIKDLKEGCDILICTPGRLIDLLGSNDKYSSNSFISLSQVRYLVIDEADNLLDMGFQQDLDKIILGFDLPDIKNRQTLLFSATFPPQVKYLFNNYLYGNYCFITTKENLDYDGEVVNANISQKFFLMPHGNSINVFDEKLKYCHNILQKISLKTLIFCNRKTDVDTLCFRFNQMDYNILKIHGDMSQASRREAIKNFTLGSVPLLIATDVASRGLDIPNVDFVILFDMPTDIQSYVHRVGRTGRAGRKGYSLTLLTQGDKNIFPKLINLLKKSNSKIPSFLYE